MTTQEQQTPVTEKPDVVVRTEKLSKVYTDLWGRAQVGALHDLNLEIRRGEVFGLLGPNGSGKTTTIKLLLGLIFPTAGNAWIFGREPRDVAVKSQIGFLPEDSCFYRFLTARETLQFYGKLFDIPSKELKDRVNRLLERVRLTHAADRPVGSYSKGMARRVGLAQALINEPQLVILDEPTSGLDPHGARETKDLIESLKAEGKTVLITSHLLADVEDLCDRVAILFQGQLQVCGNVRDLLRQGNLTDVRMRSLRPDQRSRLEAFLAAEKIDTVHIDNPCETLEEYFLRATTPGTDRKEG